MTTNPLANLKDIHMPPAIGIFPLAQGWYIIFGILALALIIGVFFAIRYLLRYKKLHLALTELERIQNLAVQQPQLALENLSVLLRRVALTRFPREQIANLHGDPWLNFLNTTGKMHEFTTEDGKIFASSPYQKTITANVNPLFLISKKWLKRVI